MMMVFPSGGCSNGCKVIAVVGRCSQTSVVAGAGWSIYVCMEGGRERYRGDAMRCVMELEMLSGGIGWQVVNTARFKK